MSKTSCPTLAEAAAALRAGRVSARELADAAIAARHERHQAYCAIDDQRTLADADLADAAFKAGHDLGVLQGIPVSVKDIFAVQGYPTYAGSPRELPAPWQEEGPTIRRLRRQLPAITGKTRTVEFAFGGIGTNEHWPSVLNPLDPERVSGGSSAGAGVSLAEGSALLALGTDTAGSVRIPASFTGNAGLKTTSGRWSIEGIVPLSPTLDTPGLLARTVEDLAHAFAALDGERPARGPLPALPTDLAGVRIGVPEGLLFEGCEPGIGEAVDEALKTLERHGARLVRRDLAGTAEAFDLLRAGSVQAPELYEFLSTTLADWLETLGSNVRARVNAGQEMTAVEYLRRRRLLRDLARTAAAAFDGIDVYAAPTVAIAPPRFDEVATPETYRERNMLALRNTATANMLALCALTMPVGTDAKGMPVGLQLIAPPLAEETLLSIGRRAERAVGYRRD